MSATELTSIPAWRDTRRAGTNHGYFDFKQFKLRMHIESSDNSISVVYYGHFLTL
jgi:hypothetical protein